MNQEHADITTHRPVSVFPSSRFDTEQFFGTDAGLFSVDLGRSGASDQTLRALANQMRYEQRDVLGHIQIKGTANGKCKCREMYLVDLSSGDLVQISENRGNHARGCHLDWSTLADIAMSVEADLSRAPDILIINRFGRAEAAGKGMRPAIEKALSMKIPIIVGVRSGYAEVWQSYHDGLAQSVSFSITP